MQHAIPYRLPDNWIKYNAHSVMNALTAVTVNTAAMNWPTRNPGVMSAGAVQRRDFPHLARHRRDPVAAIGRQRLQQPEVLQVQHC